MSAVNKAFRSAASAARPISGSAVLPETPRVVKKSQKDRFIEAAREAGCSEVEAVFDAALKKIVKTKPDAQKSDDIPNSPAKKQ